MYVNVCNAAPGTIPGGKHVLKMASSPDSVEERRRLQRERTQRYRDRQNEDARARRRQSDRDRRRAARQRATEARRRPQEPPEERSVCTPPPRLKDASPSLYTLWFSYTWFTPVGAVNSPHVSARGLTAHAYA